MPKEKTAFFCQHCGYESPRWVGKCPSCEAWNTFVEEVVIRQVGSGQPSKSLKGKAVPQKLSNIATTSEHRIITPDKEFNRVLGGGIVPGSLTLIGGEPGIGKSTLVLQVGLSLSSYKTLYISGEESVPQIKMRAKRLHLPQPLSNHLYILTETGMKAIFSAIRELQPRLVIIDSIQTLQSDEFSSPAGSVGQVRQCAAELLCFAKASHVPVLLVGHVTKDGMLAGPKALEHMLDTALYFEGDRHFVYRILRTTKNRFGATSEIGIYEMLGTGLRQVTNPSEILISPRDHSASGTTVGATLEGSRPLLIEVQSLVNTASYGTPQRSPTGFAQKRLNMLLAVLEKRGSFLMGNRDVFVNMAGGITVEDPAIDLAVCVAVVSSIKEIQVNNRFSFAAEVGLGGELRAVSQIERRVSEADKLGFERIYLAKHNWKASYAEKAGIQVKPFDKLTAVLQDVFRGNE